MVTDETHYGPEGRAFYGAVTISERGQVVIPAAARRDFNLNAGDKLLVLGDPAQGLAFITFDAMGKLFAANPLMAQELGPRVEGTTPTEEK
jgi:AbrB family looped-hinge helix DNA binding protein